MNKSERDEFALYGVSKDGLEFFVGYFEEGINGGLDGACEYACSMYRDGDTFTAIQDSEGV